MEFFLLDTVILYPVLAYAVLFFGMFVEGDIILFTAGYLANFGLFTFGNVLGISIVGMLVGDCCWYALGTARVLPLWIRRALQRIAAPLDDMLAYRTTRMLLIAKFSYGIHRLILLRAGQNRIGFRRFMERDIFATVLWAVIVASLGYASSYSLSHIPKHISTMPRWDFSPDSSSSSSFKSSSAG